MDPGARLHRLVGCVASGIALVRGWAAAPVFALGTTLIGVAVGFIDATHDATRGALVASCFAVAAIGATWLGLRQLTMQRWQRDQLRRASTGLSPLDDAVTVASDVPAAPGAATTDAATTDARSDTRVR